MALATRALVPSRRMPSLMPRPQSSNPFLSFRQEIDQMFDDFFGSTGLTSFADREPVMMPNIDVFETDNGLQVKVDLPGVAEDDIDVELNEDILTIRGERRSDHEESDNRRHLVERSYGFFVRSVQLPFAVDPNKVEASFDNGVLTITLPRPPEAQQRSKKIAVRRAGQQQTASLGQADQEAAQQTEEQQAASKSEGGQESATAKKQRG
jgi:HSP20 family protein